jgi:hypothetical protein
MMQAQGPSEVVTDRAGNVRPEAGSKAAFEAAVAGRHPGVVGIVGYFAWSHLPTHLQAVSRPAGLLALEMTATLPDGPELTAGLRKLLEAKDCFVRAAL